MNLFVTGGSGFLGRRVVEQAVRAGHEVSALARSPRSAHLLRDLGATPVPGDLADPRSIDHAFRAAAGRTLLNIASLGFGHAGMLVAAARAAGLHRALFISTTGIFTTLDPPSKAVRTAAENTIRTSDLHWTIIRPTMIYGAPDDRNMARLLTLLRRCPVLPVPGGGDQLQQPVHVDDLAALILRAADAEIAVGRCYDAAGPESLTFREIVAAAGAAVGRRVLCVPVPVSPVRALVGSYEKRAARPRLKAEQIARLVEDKAFDIGAARRDLGFAPRSFVEGIRAEAVLLGARGRRRAARPAETTWASP